MTITHAAKNAVYNLKTNKTRTFLTLLGMVIGISSVIIIMAVGAGAQSLILNQIIDIGSNLVVVYPGGSDEEGPPASIMGITITSLKYEDVKAILKKGNVTHLEAAAGYVRGTGTITWKNRSVDTDFTGTTSTYIDVESTEVEFGRFIKSILVFLDSLKGCDLKEKIRNTAGFSEENSKTGSPIKKQPST